MSETQNIFMVYVNRQLIHVCYNGLCSQSLLCSFTIETKKKQETVMKIIL